MRWKSGSRPLPRQTQRKASPFWIMLLLVWGGCDYRMIRQNGNSAVRILPPQPASPGSRDFHFNRARKPAVRGLVALRAESLRPEFDKFSPRCRESLRPCSALFPFSGETGRRLGSTALRGRVAVDRPPIVCADDARVSEKFPPEVVRLYPVTLLLVYAPA